MPDTSPPGDSSETANEGKATPPWASDPAATAEQDGDVDGEPPAEALLSSRRRSIASAATTTAGAVRRLHQHTSDVTTRLLSEERVSTASQKVTAVFTEERTERIIAASAKLGARIAADALSRRGSEELASAVRAFGVDHQTPTPLKPTDTRNGADPAVAATESDPAPLAGDQIAAFLAARRAARSRSMPGASQGAPQQSPPLAAQHAKRTPQTPSRPPRRPVARPAPTSPATATVSDAVNYPTKPMQLVIGPEDSFRIEHHPELTAFTIEVSPTGGREYVLSIEWKHTASRFCFNIDDLPKEWQRVEHEGIAHPVQLRRTGKTIASVSFLDPGDAARTAEESRRTHNSSKPPGPSAGQLMAALRQAHEDRMAVIRNTHA